MIAGYDDVSALLADSRLSVDKRRSSGGYSSFPLPSALDRNLLNLEGDEHGRLRRLAAPAFSARTVLWRTGTTSAGRWSSAPIRCHSRSADSP
ncbi:hypothetical protein [Nocardia sp. GAS34]|uniref:hypothetical protein n=1 Tax=unclassified Nocardia TaxID=2637762 RepID=UPI003D20C40D